MWLTRTCLGAEEVLAEVRTLGNVLLVFRHRHVVS